MTDITRKINGYKCEKCKTVSLAAAVVAGRCPNCGNSELQSACAAKGRKGRLCGKTPMENGRCYFHGGASPAPGPTHPNYKHGRLSKVLPPALSKLYEDARNDPELLSITPDVALLDAMQAETAARLETGESAANWRLLKKTWGELERGMAMKRDAAATESDELRQQMMQEGNQIIADCMQAVGRLIGTGASYENQKDELRDITNNLVQVKAAENARLQRSARTMTEADAALFLYQLQQAVCSIITDRSQLEAIGRALQHIQVHGVAPEPVRVAPVVTVPSIIESSPIPPAAE